MSVRRDLHEANRRSWNAALPAQNSHRGDQVAFFAGGGSQLFAEERVLLGPLNGLDVLHLPCNAGQDSLSLVNEGARSVVGVDISDSAIAVAASLAEQTGLPARFDRADVFDWLPQAAADGQRFDRVLTSYGTIGWFSDLALFVAGVRGVLRPGGRLVLVDWHPMALCWESDGRLRYPYASGEVLSFDDGVGDYVGLSGAAQWPGTFVDGERGFHNGNPDHEWAWGIADIIGAVLDAGLTLDAFEEYGHSNAWRIYDDCRDGPDRTFLLPEGMPWRPLMFGLAASLQP